MQFTVTKTTTETYAVEAEHASAAKEQFEKDGGNQITLNTQLSVQPRPQSLGGQGRPTLTSTTTVAK